MKQKRLAIFQPKNYYTQAEDKNILDTNNQVVRLLPKGMNLVRQYYKKKYNAEIILLPEKFDLNEYLNPIRTAKIDNYRIAFILGSKSGHAIPMIYLRENGREGLLYADSQGTDSEEDELDALDIAAEANILNTYVLRVARQ